MLCPHCRVESAEGSRFCYACGRPLLAEAVAPAQVLGYATRGAQPGTGYRSPRGHGTRAAVMLAIMAVMDALMALAGSLTAHSYGQGHFSRVEPSTPELVLGCVSLPYLLGTILSCVFFLIWMHRVSANLPALGRATPRFSPGWAVGCWFVPFANLVWPYQAMREIWIESAPGSESSGGSTAIVKWWWAAWLVSNIIGSIAGRVSLTAESAQVAAAAEWCAVLASLIGIAAALLAFVIVRRITKNQDVRYAERYGASLG